MPTARIVLFVDGTQSPDPKDYSFVADSAVDIYLVWGSNPPVKITKESIDISTGVVRMMAAEAERRPW